MITYSDPQTKEKLYDTNTLRIILKVSPSYLKREIRKYGFKDEDCVKYKNLTLYREMSVLKFINHLVEYRFGKQLSYLKGKLEKMNGEGNGLS